MSASFIDNVRERARIMGTWRKNEKSLFKIAQSLRLLKEAKEPNEQVLLLGVGSKFDNKTAVGWFT